MPISVVGTSTTSEAINFGFQRKTFYTNGRFWVFYSDGTNMVYRTSNDGTTWSASTTIRTGVSGGRRFSIYFDGTYLHYVCTSEIRGDALYYRRGTPNADGSITWSATEQTVVAGVSGIAYYYPTIAVDSNGYVWIGYQRNDGTNYYPYVTRSGNNDGTWGTTPAGFPYQLSTTSAGWVVDVQPLTAGKMFVSYVYGTGSMYVRVWTGSAWTTQISTTQTIYAAWLFSAVAQGDNVHIVMVQNTSPYNLIYFQYIYSSNSFTSATTLTSTSDNIAPAITRYNNDFYVFWTDTTTNHIYYRHYNAATSTWEATVDWINESSAKLSSVYDISAFYVGSGVYVGVVYETGSTSPWNIKFAYLVVSVQYSSTFTEVISLTDYTLKGSIVTKAEAITLSDVFQVIRGKVLSEIILLTDSMFKGNVKVLSETVSLSDIYTRTWQTFQTFTESITLTDLLSAVRAKILTEVLTMLDTLNRSTLKALAESITLTDLRTIGVTTTKTESITLTDLLSKVNAKTLLEVLTMLDRVSRIQGRILIESVQLSDTFARTIAIRKLLSETLTPVDTLRLFRLLRPTRVRPAQRILQASRENPAQ